MRSLTLYKNDAFVPLGGVTEDDRSIASQAFSFLLFTELGSIPLEAGVGTDLVLGKSNVTTITMQMQTAVNAVFQLMRVPYELESANIISIDKHEDGVRASIKIKSSRFTGILNFVV